jgi:hypothetical protein
MTPSTSNGREFGEPMNDYVTTGNGSVDRCFGNRSSGGPVIRLMPILIGRPSRVKTSARDNSKADDQFRASSQ